MIFSTHDDLVQEFIDKKKRFGELGVDDLEMEIEEGEYGIDFD